MVSISIHAPREGSDHEAYNIMQSQREFLSTLPARGATEGPQCGFAVQTISIHAPREGSDDRIANAWYKGYRFLSTLPARGATHCHSGPTQESGTFLSTLPARGATQPGTTAWGHSSDFYPRSPRGERHPFWRSSFLRLHFYPRSPRGERRRRAAGPCLDTIISIHAPREGSDLFGPGESHPRRRISIHAPREGSDLRPCYIGMGRRDFYPRSPRGERLVVVIQQLGVTAISIHAPREGSDKFPKLRSARSSYFYPRSPRGERPAPQPKRPRPPLFLSTLPARGATLPGKLPHGPIYISIHAPREGSDYFFLA